MKKITIVAVVLTTLAFSYGLGVAGEQQDINDISGFVRQGNLSQADSLAQQLVKDYPDNSASHWVYANVLIAEGDVTNARAQLNIAKNITPGLTYVNPNYAAHVEEHLASEEQTAKDDAISEIAHKRMVHRVMLYGFVILIFGTFIGYLLIQRKRTKDEIRNRFYPKTPPKTRVSNPVHTDEYVKPDFRGSGVVVHDSTYYPQPRYRGTVIVDTPVIDPIIYDPIVIPVMEPIIEPQQVQEPSYPDPDPVVNDSNFGITDSSAIDNTPDTDFGIDDSSATDYSDSSDSGSSDN